MEDPGQVPRSAASDLDLHRLHYVTQKARHLNRIVYYIFEGFNELDHWIMPGITYSGRGQTFFKPIQGIKFRPIKKTHQNIK